MRFTLATSVVALVVLAAAAPQSAERRTGDGVSIPLTKRSTLVNADKSVNIDALNSHVEFVMAKILRGFENYERNTGTRHPSVGNNIGKRGVVDPLTDANGDEFWYSSISVGTPAKSFTVLVDTGSSDLFLPGSTCGLSCSGHTLYDPSSSSTSQDLSKTFSLLYGDGSTVTGEQYTDTVSIAGLTATGQTLGAATQYSTGFESSQFPADGLIGMAFPHLSNYPASPVFQTLVSEGEVTDPVFSFKLSSTGAELYIGGTDDSLYRGSFAYTPVTVQGYWQVSMDSVQANGQSILSNVAAIIDTGTTLIFGTPSDVSSLYSYLGGTPFLGQEGFYTFPCNSFPDISFTFGGSTFEIASSALNLGPVSFGSSDCLSGLASQSITAFPWIVGDVFLRGVYTTFDVGNSQVGFAQLA